MRCLPPAFRLSGTSVTRAGVTPGAAAHNDLSPPLHITTTTATNAHGHSLPPPFRMDEVCGQSRLFAAGGSDVRLPVAHMVCNQTPPVGEKPSLMTFREVGGRDCYCSLVCLT